MTALTSFAAALAAIQKYKKIQKAFEVIGLVIAILVYLQKPPFWVFLGVVVGVVLVWAVVVGLEHFTFRRMTREKELLAGSGALGDDQKAELEELWEEARKEVGVAVKGPRKTAG